MKLNQEQQEAVCYLGGPLFVLAGAGSGKTRVITEKIAYMIQKVVYKPHHIAAITFTNKAAKEMQERISLRLGKEHTRGLTISTFHALGMKILREDAHFLGYKKNFSILDSSDCTSILTELSGSPGKEMVFKLRHQISLWKNDLITPETALTQANDDWTRRAAQIYANYQARLENYQALDFDDLIRLPVLLLREHAAIRYRWQERLRYLLVDECQDTNACQYALLRLLTGLAGNFTAVGDDDQSIYAWRGADMKNLRRLQEDYPQLKIIKLEQNYRSSACILRVANQVIANNDKLFPKSLWSKLGEGNKVRVIACQNEEHEAKYVAGQIAFLHATQKRPYADFAVLYRGNHQSRIFEEALREARIPYQLSGGQSFYDKAEIKDVLAYLRLISNPDDDPAFLRSVSTPKRGIGDTTLGKLNEYAKKHHTSLFQAAQNEDILAQLSTKSRESLQTFIAYIQATQEKAQKENAGEVLETLLNDINYEQHLFYTEENSRVAENRWRNVCDLKKWYQRKSQEKNKNLMELTQIISLITLLESKEEEIDAVKLSTLHAAKGLEYACVYLVGCEEGLFPHEESINNDQIDEERRLMYVGITRAKQELTLTHCVKRKKSGVWQFPEPSRFIDEMPQQDLEILGRKGGKPIVSKEEQHIKLQDLLTQLRQTT